MTKTDNKIRYPVLFLDDWPQHIYGPTEEDEFEQPGMNNLKRLRLQTLLASNPMGIPSLAFTEYYKRMFDKELHFDDLGFSHLSEMVSKLSDIFAVQEPSEATALLFPDYPDDKILHDARLGHKFCSLSMRESNDPDTMIIRAQLKRQLGLPSGVVMPGERYDDILMPMTPAKISGTRGIHQVIIVGAASPSNFNVQIKTDLVDRVASLSAEVFQYFKEFDGPIDTFRLPEDFIYPGFPCLVHIKEDGCFERCEIICRQSRNNLVLIETVDYGGIHSVSAKKLFLMPRKFFDFPRQGITVSLTGLKPYCGNKKFSKSAGTRMRCFSWPYYTLDCLLLEPKRPPIDQESTKSKLLEVNPNRDPIKEKKKEKKRPVFEAIVCDRNDEEYDVYLDEILVMETYASMDESRAEEVDDLRKRMKEALKNIPRPVNTMA